MGILLLPCSAVSAPGRNVSAFLIYNLCIIIKGPWKLMKKSQFVCAVEQWM